MSEFNPNQDHLKHCLLYEFYRKSSAAVAAKNIKQTYGAIDSLSDKNCNKKFKKFGSRDNCI
jgi:HTH domain in Mos1 transposase